MIDNQYIKEKLDEYLEFDSNLLFRPMPNGGILSFILMRVFGGAIRDIIAGKEIHDVDILVGSQTFDWAKEILVSQGYHYNPSLTKRDIDKIYTDIKIISEPHTLIKNNKVVQLIRPRYVSIDNKSNNLSKEEYKKNFVNLIQNVDYSCCAVSYDGYKLYQNFPNSIIHCQNHVFTANKSAVMYSHERAFNRKYKLEIRGWKQIDSIRSERNEIIENILKDKGEVIYINELSQDLFQ